MPVIKRDYPPSVDDRTVIVGGGLHALVVAATMAVCERGRPIVIEKHPKTGGMFEQLTNFKMNSANGASVESVLSPGPTRVPSRSASDDLNWIPNSYQQVRAMSGMVEYPYSNDMSRAIQQGLSAYAEVYTGVTISYNVYGEVYADEERLFDSLGIARRIIFAGGLVPPADLPAGQAILSGYEYMKRPVRDLAGKKIALIGGGDTAAQCAEIMLGQGVTMPTSAPDCIHWYGGENMPATKGDWMRRIHARWVGLGRALPEGDEYGEAGRAGVVVPYTVKGEVIPIGEAAMVNGQVYDLAVMATGFDPAPCPVTTNASIKLGGVTVARGNDINEPLRSRVFKVGTAAGIDASYRPYKSRFPQAKQAIYNLAPRTAALIAALPA